MFCASFIMLCLKLKYLINRLTNSTINTLIFRWNFPSSKFQWIIPNNHKQVIHFTRNSSRQCNMQKVNIYYCHFLLRKITDEMIIKSYHVFYWFLWRIFSITRNSLFYSKTLWQFCGFNVNKRQCNRFQKIYWILIWKPNLTI